MLLEDIPAFDWCLLCARITQTIVTDRCALVFATRQRLAADFIAWWTLIVTTFSIARMFVAVTHTFAFGFACVCL